MLEYFIHKGLTRAQAAGIVGNTRQESGTGETSPNIFQGQGGRTSSGTLQQQLDGVWRELTTTYLGALHNLQRTDTPEAAARVFSDQFEQPGVPELGKRERYAHEAYIGQTSGLFAPSGESAGEILNPFNTGTFERPVKDVEEAVKAAGAGVSLVTALLEPATWLRIAEGIGGIVLIYMGLSTLSRRGGARDVIGTTRQASSGPRKVVAAAV